MVRGMFDEELPKSNVMSLPRNLDNLSVSELEDYIGVLRGEIERVERDKVKKKASQGAAESLFKV